MAWLAFLFLWASGAAILFALLFDPERESIAKALSAGSVVVVMIIGTFVSIVGAYLGVSLKEALAKVGP